MMKLQTGTAAFLYNNNNVLLIKRSENKRFAPGFWCGVGGHMEPHELNNPCETCYREIEEETGIQRSNIHSLKLLYVIVRMFRGDTIVESNHRLLTQARKLCNVLYSNLTFACPKPRPKRRALAAFLGDG